MSLRKVGLAFKDYLLLKKLIVFLFNLNDVPQEERQKFIDKLNKEKHRQRVGESLFLFLDRYDHFDKIHLLSDLFKAYLRGKIGYEEFLRFSAAIDRAFIVDLNDMLDYFSDKKVKNEGLWEHLYASGLSELALDVGVDDGLGVGIVVTKRMAKDQILRYTFNTEAAKFAMIILGDNFKHPLGLIWDEKGGFWKPDYT
jgi:hypothetical protein